MSVFQPTSTDEWVRDQTKRTNLNDRRPRPSTERVGTPAQRDAMYVPPANLAQRVALANRQVRWFNTTQGWWESYYTTTGEAGLLVRGLRASIAGVAVAPGWYPMPDAGGPRRRLVGNGSQAMGSGSLYTNWRTTGEDTFWIGSGAQGITPSTATGQSLTVGLAGEYDLEYRLGLQAGSGTGVFGIYRHWAAATWILLDPGVLLAGYGTSFQGAMRVQIPAAGAIGMGVNSGTLTVGGTNYNTGLFDLRYTSPPFAS